MHRTMTSMEPRAISSRQPEGDPGSWRDHFSTADFIIESWSQGFLVCGLLIMACITISNMRAGIFLHKLILLELFLAMFHGTFCFMSFEGYGWYLSSTAALLYMSWIVHNLVAWFKIRLFMTPKASMIFIGTLCLTFPPIVLQIVNNFLFFNNMKDLYIEVRPFEALFRDPWWIMSCVLFVYVIKTRYKMSVMELIYGHPRFAIMLLAMVFSILFTVVDIVASVIPDLSAVSGINPYWKIALVFKALTDTIILDDFKTCLERLRGDLAEKQDTWGPQPPPVPPKDGHVKNKSSVTTCNTARTSPTLVQGQSPQAIPQRTISRKPVGGQQQVQRPRSARNTLYRLGSRLSPLPSGTTQMRNSMLSSRSQQSTRSGEVHTIDVHMDLGLTSLAHGDMARRSSNGMESPLDPAWPRFMGLARGRSVLSSSNGNLSNKTRSIASTVPPVADVKPASTSNWAVKSPPP